MKPTFEWTCSYMGVAWYRVHDRSGMYEVELRNRISDYELSITNGEQARRDKIAAIGILRRTDGGSPLFEVPRETVDAFNVWRLTERAKFVAELKAQPHRYGNVDENDHALFPPILPARQGHYVIGEGWR